MDPIRDSTPVIGIQKKGYPTHKDRAGRHRREPERQRPGVETPDTINFGLQVGAKKANLTLLRYLRAAALCKNP